MVDTPSAARLPVYAWLPYVACAGALALTFTPYRDAAYPLVALGALVFLFLFTSHTSKGRARVPLFFLITMTVPYLVLVYAVLVSSWGNVWLALAPSFGIFPFVVRYSAFRQLGYARALWLEPTSFALAVVSYVVGNLAPPDGYIGWIAVGPFALISIWGIHLSVLRPLAMRRIGGGALGPGDPAPDFTMRSHRDEDVSLSDFRGERLVLLFFVRGDWCPGCHILLRAYERNRAKFEAKNVAVLAIGPDPIGLNREMVDTLQLQYGLLHDEGLATARKFGVLLEGWETGGEYPEGLPVPTAFLVDLDGIIRFSSGTQVGSILEPDAIFPILESSPATRPAAA